MMQEKGHCKHGEFNLAEGCPQCIADRMQKEGNTEADIAEAVKTASETAAPVPEAEIALAKAPGSNVEVMSYYTEALKLLNYAEKRVITTVEHIKVANDDLSVISNLKKAMEAKKREYLDPLRAEAEAIRETYSTLMDPVFRADKITRDKILDYTRKQEELNQKRIELAEAEQKATGEVTFPIVLTEEVKRVSTDMGTTGLRDNWCFEVVDFAQLPDEYKIADSAMLHAIAKKHHNQKLVPGVRFYNQPIIAVKAR